MIPIERVVGDRHYERVVYESTAQARTCCLIYTATVSVIDLEASETSIDSLISVFVSSSQNPS